MEIPELPPLPSTMPSAAPPAAIVQVDKPRALGPSFPSISPATEASFRAFETMIGGRQTLVSKLALTVSSKAEEAIVGLLADPAHDKIPLGVLCRLGKIPLRKLMELYRDAALVMSQVQAIDKVAESLPAVAVDVMNRAQTHRVTCATCQGTTTIQPEPTKDDKNPDPKTCPDCRGYGNHIAEPDHEVQKTALALGGFLKKDSGTSITLQQNNQQLVMAGSSAGFDEVIEKLDTVLFGAARDRVARRAQTVVDADLVAPADPADTEGAAPPTGAPQP